MNKSGGEGVFLGAQRPLHSGGEGVFLGVRRPLHSGDEGVFLGVRRRVAALDGGDASPPPNIWPHAPAHYLFEDGIYIVTAGTYRKAHVLNSAEKLELVMQSLFSCASEFKWELHAWAVLANHYHFVAKSNAGSQSLHRLVGKLHMTTSRSLNRLDGSPGRKVWFQYWESRITFERSYLARLNYVNQNPVHHAIALAAVNYRWCSAAWFERKAPRAFVKAVKKLKTDAVRVFDEF